MMELSKDEKERQLDAKIAAIRAKNEEKLQRQREVEKDRKLAEKQNQSVTTAPRVKVEGEYEHHFVGPDRNDKVLAGAGGKQPPQRNIRREESYDKKDRPGDKKGGRLRDGEGPPPDPGYRFLADRWRDGSDSEHGEAEAENGDRPRRQQRRDEQQPWARGGGGGELEMEAQPAGSLSQLMTSSQEGGGDDYAAEDLAPPSNNIQKCPSAPNIHHMTTVLHILRFLKVGTLLVIGLGSFLQMPPRRPMPTKGPPCQLCHGPWPTGHGPLQS